MKPGAGRALELTDKKSLLALRGRWLGVMRFHGRQSGKRGAEVNEGFPLPRKRMRLKKE